MDNEKGIIIAGFGGQGVLLAGEILANAYMIDGKNVTWYPSYGAEMRGGTVNCEVVVSDTEVSSVNKQKTDFLIALNQQSFDKFLPRLVSGATVIANSSLIEKSKPRDDINYIFAPITDLATEIKQPKAANVVSLGVFSEVSRSTSHDSLVKALDNVFGHGKQKLIPINIDALKIGQENGFLATCC